MCTHVCAHVCFNTHLVKKFYELNKCEGKPKKRADRVGLVKTVLFITKPFSSTADFSSSVSYFVSLLCQGFFFPVVSFHPQFSTPATHLHAETV